MDILGNIMEIQPGFSDAAIFLGNLAFDARFFDRSEMAYEAAAKAGNEESVFGFKNLAYEARMQKQNDEATRYLEKAKKYFPNDLTIEAEILDLKGE